MCRNIKTLHNFEPPASADEIDAAALQFVRKLAGTNKPSKANQPIFDASVAKVSLVATELLEALTSQAPPRNREIEAAKAKLRTQKRFGR
jgi:hypothetical protein